MSFKHFPHSYKSKYHRRRLEIHSVKKRMKRFRIGRHAHFVKQCHAVYKCRRTAHRNESIHIRCTVKQAFGTTDKEFLIYYHYGNRYYKLRDSKDEVIFHKLRNPPAPHNVSHRYIHKRNKQTDRSYQSEKNLPCFRAVINLRLLFFGVFCKYARTVSGGRNRRAYFFIRCGRIECYDH